MTRGQNILSGAKTSRTIGLDTQPHQHHLRYHIPVTSRTRTHAYLPFIRKPRDSASEWFVIFCDDPGQDFEFTTVCLWWTERKHLIKQIPSSCFSGHKKTLRNTVICEKHKNTESLKQGALRFQVRRRNFYQCMNLCFSLVRLHRKSGPVRYRRKAEVRYIPALTKSPHVFAYVTHPGGHGPLRYSVEFATQKYPAGHGVHSSCPSRLLYVPASQARGVSLPAGQ